MTNYSRSVLKSNGLRHSKNLPVKFGFSLKTVPANIAKSYRHNAVPNCISSHFSASRTNGPRSLSRVKAGTHSAFGEGSHTAACTPKQGPSFPRPQRGFALPVKSILFRHAFIYIHFPVLCEPSTPAEENNPAKLPSQLCPKPLFIAFFNFSHKRPTFAFTSESGYTLAFANRIAHKGLHGETRAFRMGVVSLPSERFTRFGNPAWPSIRTANFAAFEPWSRALSKNAESLGTAMRSCVSLFRGVAAPLGCVIFFAFVEIAVFTPCA